MIYRDYLKDKYQSTAVKFANAEGVPCVLEKSKGKPLKNYEVYGNSVQNGTPTPESPVEIQSVGDLTTKNLLPYPFSETTITRYGVTFTDNGDGSVTVNGTATANAIWYFYKDTKNLINGLKVGDTITVSIDYDKTWALSPMTMYIVCNYYNSEATMKDGNCVINWVNKYKTITIGDDWAGIGFYVVVYKGQTVDNITLRAQIELGSNATEYEPYHKYDIPITVTGTDSITEHIYLNEPLRKVGDYADYVDFKNKKVVRTIGSKVFDGTEIFGDGYVSQGFITCPLRDHLDKYIAILTRSTWNASSTMWANSQNLRFTISYYNVSSVDEFKTKLAGWYSDGKPLTICYALNTPTEENISLPALKTFKGTSIISVGAEIQPSKFTLQYYKG